IRVVADAAECLRSSLAALESVVALGTEQLVVVIATVKVIVVRAAVEHVFAVAAVQSIGASAAAQDVVVVQTLERVIAAFTEQLVRGISALECVGVAVSESNVASRRDPFIEDAFDSEVVLGAECQVGKHDVSEYSERD